MNWKSCPYWALVNVKRKYQNGKSQFKIQNI